MKIVHTGDPGFEGLWEELWNADEIQHPFLTRLDIAYSREFERNSDYHDLSFVVVEHSNLLPARDSLLEEALRANLIYLDLEDRLFTAKIHASVPTIEQEPIRHSGRRFSAFGQMRESRLPDIGSFGRFFPL